MTNRDRESAARLLLQIADRLADAPAKAEATASHAFTGTAALNYQIALLKQALTGQAAELRSLVASLLSPARGGGARRRR